MDAKGQLIYLDIQALLTANNIKRNQNTEEKYEIY